MHGKSPYDAREREQSLEISCLERLARWAQSLRSSGMLELSIRSSGEERNW